MTAVERIKEQLASNPVLLYMKGTPDFPQCGFSAQTVGALRACKAKFAIHQPCVGRIDTGAL